MGWIQKSQLISTTVRDSANYKIVSSADTAVHDLSSLSSEVVVLLSLGETI